MGFDIIGDIHGCAETLSALLETLGYRDVNGVYQHPTRKVIFVGDFVDRGPYQKQTISIARNMVEYGHALAVMGNHEFNAISYATFDAASGHHLRKHTEKNREQHEAFLKAFDGDERGYDEAITWFKSLPLWLEVDGVRVVHACWDDTHIKRLKQVLDPGNLITDEVLRHSSDEKRWEFEAIETLLKGKEVLLPNNHHFYDKDKNKRQHIRVRWWDNTAKNLHAAYLGPIEAISHIPDDELNTDHLIEYDSESPPIFFGHYWMTGRPVRLAPNVACLDYSVAKPGGMLVAYRWDGEGRLSDKKYVTIGRIEA